MSQYLTTQEAADYVKAKSYGAFDAWARRNGVKCTARYGRHRRYTKEQLDAAMRAMALRKSA